MENVMGARQEQVVSTVVAAPRKIALLKEWHASLSEIAARDPLAIETRRTMAHIESELRELGSEEKSKKIVNAPEPTRRPGVLGP